MSGVPFFDLGVLVDQSADEIELAVSQVVRSGQYVGGPVVERFEHEFAEYLGSKHCIGVANGLDALRIALEAKGIGEGDEVIVPAFTFYATLLSVMQTGATPVPVDVLPSTANIDASLIEAAVTARTRAIVAVHLYGQTADMEGVLAVAARHGVPVFEDTAQAHGARSALGMTGAVSTAGAFSFYPTKNLGALGDAGAIITSDDDLARIARSRRSYGQGSTKYEHVDFGWNSRLDPVQAAILLVNLRRLDAWNARRVEIAAAYREALAHRAAAAIGPVEVADSVWHHFVLRAADRQGLRDALAEAGVATDIHYPYAASSLDPVRAHSPSRESAPMPVAEALALEVTSLPMGPWMTDIQVSSVCDAISRLPDDLLVLEA